MSTISHARSEDFHRVLTVENPEMILATAVQSALTVENPKMVLATACFLLLRQKRESKNEIAKTRKQKREINKGLPLWAMSLSLH